MNPQCTARYRVKSTETRYLTTHIKFHIFVDLKKVGI